MPNGDKKNEFVLSTEDESEVLGKRDTDFVLTSEDEGEILQKRVPAEKITPTLSNTESTVPDISPAPSSTTGVAEPVIKPLIEEQPALKFDFRSIVAEQAKVEKQKVALEKEAKLEEEQLFQDEVVSASSKLKFQDGLFFKTQDERQNIQEDLADQGLSEDAIAIAMSNLDRGELERFSEDFDKQEMKNAKEGLQVASAFFGEGKIDFTDEEIVKELFNTRVDFAVKQMNPRDRNIFVLNSELQEIASSTEKSSKDRVRMQAILEEITGLREGTTNFLFDPETGELTGNEEASEAAIEYEDAVTNEASSLRKTFKDKIGDVFNDAYLKLQAVDEFYNQPITIKRVDGAEINTTNRELTTLLIDPLIQGDEKKSALRIKEIWTQAKFEFDAATRAYLLNEDPAGVEKNFFSILGTSLLRNVAILPSLFPEGIVGTTNKDYIEAYEKLARQESLPLTEEQVENFKVTFKDKVAEGLGGFLAILPELIAYGAVLETGAGFAGLSSLISTLSKGSKVEKFTSFLLKASIEETKLQLAGFEKGGGTGFVLAGGLMAKGGFRFTGKFGKILEPFMNKIVQGTAGGTLGLETAGVLESATSALLDDKDFKTELKKHFGENLEEVTEKVLVDAVIMSAFGGFKGVVAGGKALINQKRLLSAAKDLRENGFEKEAKFMEDKAAGVVETEKAATKEQKQVIGAEKPKVEKEAEKPAEEVVEPEKEVEAEKKEEAEKPAEEVAEEEKLAEEKEEPRLMLSIMASISFSLSNLNCCKSSALMSFMN